MTFEEAAITARERKQGEAMLRPCCQSDSYVRERQRESQREREREIEREKGLGGKSIEKR